MTDEKKRDKENAKIVKETAGFDLDEDEFEDDSGLDPMELDEDSDGDDF